MNKQKKFSRKQFFRRIAALISVPAIFFMVKGINREKDNKLSDRIAIPSNIPNGITFFDKLIVKKTGEKIVVFSSSCTHLGCKIIRETDKKLICPCHGSKFDLDGYPITGPAVKPLRKLEIERDSENGEMVVYV